MHAQHHHAVLGIQQVEFALPGFQHGRRRLHRAPGQHDRVLEKGRVVQHPAKRQLHDIRGPAADLQQIGRIVVEEIRRIVKAIFADQVQRDLAELGGGRTPASRPVARGAHQRVHAELHFLALFLRRQVDDPAVRVAVVRHLVAVVHNGAHHVRMRQRHHARNEERGLDLVARQQRQHARHADLPAVGALRHQDRAFGVGRIARRPHGLGVHIERQE
ncbi:hypothetical protein D9M69_538200 [compost metagenome]